MSNTYSRDKIMTALFVLIFFSFVLVLPPIARGMEFREDYLPYLQKLAILFAAVSLLSVAQNRGLLRGDLDVLLVVVAGLYALTFLWANSKMQAMDGALMYAGYLMVFIAARYASGTDLGRDILQHLLILHGVAVASIGFLAASGIVKHPGAVQSGMLIGTYGHPNALAAAAIPALFLLYDAWSRGPERPDYKLYLGMTYSVFSFLLLGAVFFGGCGATVLMFVAFLAVYAAALPSGLRPAVLSRIAVGLAAVGTVSAQTSYALQNKDARAMRLALALGAVIALGLEIGRTVLGAAWSRRPRKQRKRRTPLQPAILALRLLAVGTVALVIGAALLGAANASSGAKILSKVLPSSTVQQLKSMKISGEDILLRPIASKDALSIALGHPFGTGAGGWNALYHEYHRTPYWFDSPHNHFAAILAEIGFPGFLAYLGFWFLLARALWRGYLGSRGEAGSLVERSDRRRRDLRLISIGMAVLAICLHGAVDHDLAVPALSIAMYATIGLLLPSIEEHLPRLPAIPKLANLRMPGKRSRRRAAEKDQKLFPWSPVLTLVLAVALVAPTTVITNKLRAGMAYGARADEIMNTTKDQAVARKYIAEALSRDFWNADYPLKVAAWSVDEYFATNGASGKGLAPLFLQLAEMKDPSSLFRQVRAYEMLTQLALYDEAAAAAHRLVLMMPTNRQYHEYLSEATTKAIGIHTSALTNEDLEDTEKEAHQVRLGTVCQLQYDSLRILRYRRSKVTGIYARIYDPRDLEPTAHVDLAMGQVAFLAGDNESSKKHLTLAAKEPTLKAEAEKWLAYLVEATSDQHPTLGMAALHGVIVLPGFTD